ncbi:MAG: hypothetical protein Q8K75_07435 [Chlamydiales bacterium]|nr:hypothetical protein [Chlamydiales bacterium]
MKAFFWGLTIGLVAWNLTASASEPFWTKYIPDGDRDGYSSDHSEGYIPDHAYQYIPDHARKYIPDHAHRHVSDHADKYAKDDWRDYVPDGDWDEYIPGKNKKKKGGSTRYGPTVINDETLENLTVFGPTTIIDSTITGTLSVKGPLEAENSKINNVDMDGVAEFDSCKVKTLSIRGPIFAKDSKFSVISVYSNKMSFSSSLVEDMTVKKNNSRKPSTVILERSKIHSLSFEEGNGRVVLDGTSSVPDLHGGKIVNGNS